MPLNKVLAMYGYENNVEYEDTVQEVPVQDSDSSLLDTPEQTMESHSSSHSILTHSIHSPGSDSCVSELRRIDEVIDLEFREETPIPMGSSRPLLRCKKVNYFSIMSGALKSLFRFFFINFGVYQTIILYNSF